MASTVREMPLVDQQAFRRGLRIREQDPIPKKLELLYWDWKKEQWDAMSQGSNMPLSLLACIQREYDKELESDGRPPNRPEPKPPKKLIDGNPLIDAQRLFGSLKFDDPVQAKFRSKWHSARFRGITSDGKSVKVLIDNDESAEERELRPHNIKEQVSLVD